MICARRKLQQSRITFVLAALDQQRYQPAAVSRRFAEE
jgi:hypothetical protein